MSRAGGREIRREIRRAIRRAGRGGALALILLAACAAPGDGPEEGDAALSEAPAPAGAAPESILGLGADELMGEVEAGTGRIALVRRPPAAAAAAAPGGEPAPGPFAQADEAEGEDAREDAREDAGENAGEAAAAGRSGFPEPDREADREADPEADPEADRALAGGRRELGLALEATGDIEGAVSEFEAALATVRAQGGPETPWTDLARICRRGEPAAAVARACTRLLTPTRFAPDEMAGFLVNRGNAHATLGRSGLAMSDYAAALKIESSSFGALVGRARINLAEGRPQAALNDLRLAIATGPRPAEARVVRAEAWRALGNFERAAADYTAVLADEAARAWHPTAWRGRAETHCAMGRPDAAAVDWQVWADSVPGGPVSVQELLRGAGYLKGPWEPGIGPATLAALRAWTREGCP